MRRFAHVLGLVAALALVTTACASDKDTGLPTEPTEAPSTALCPATIEMTTNTLLFVPEKCEVKTGTKVTWKSASIAHTVTSEPTAPVKFDSGNVEAGEEFSFTFTQAGEIPYYCKLHASAGARSGMVGTITVTAA